MWDVDSAKLSPPFERRTTLRHEFTLQDEPALSLAIELGAPLAESPSAFNQNAWASSRGGRHGWWSRWLDRLRGREAPLRLRGGVLYRSWDLDLEEKLIADVAASLRSAGFPTAPEPPPTPSGTRRTFSLTLDGPSRVLGKPDCVRVELSPASPLPEPRAEICTVVDGIVAAALGKRMLGVRPRRDVRVLPRRKRGRNGP